MKKSTCFLYLTGDILATMRRVLLRWGFCVGTFKTYIQIAAFTYMGIFKMFKVRPHT